MVRIAVLVLGVLFLSGCIATKANVASDVPEAQPGKRILVMPLDVELSLLSASGLREVNAEWTRQGIENVRAALSGALTMRNTEFYMPEMELEARPIEDSVTQLLKLHAAVGNAILLHQYQSALALPSRSGSFDWTLGQEATSLRDIHDADYALFVHLRDSFTSGGRVAVMLLAGAVGVAVPGGQQVGFASLVDLNTGRFLWFNILQSGTGDLREPENAEKVVAALLKGAPL